MSHEGHKSRLRQKARIMLESMPEHEILEILLSYCIVRKDTNPIAHLLMDKFGTLANVLNAPYESIVEVEGMGEVSATFLNLMPRIFKVYNESQLKEVKQLKSMKDCFFYCEKYLKSVDTEHLIVVCLDARDKIISNISFSSKEDSFVKINLSELLSKIINSKACKVLISHNHVFGTTTPSSQDLVFTKKLLTLLSGVGIEMIDHVIVGKESETFSFRNAGISLLD